MSNPRADPCVFVIFGASGDLTRSKLLPAIFNLAESGHLPDAFAILGVARPQIDEAAYRAQMREQVRAAEGAPLEPEKWKRIEERLYYVSGEFNDPGLFDQLKKSLVVTTSATRCFNAPARRPRALSASAAMISTPTSWRAIDGLRAPSAVKRFDAASRNEPSPQLGSRTRSCGVRIAQVQSQSATAAEV